MEFQCGNKNCNKVIEFDPEQLISLRCQHCGGIEVKFPVAIQRKCSVCGAVETIRENEIISGKHDCWGRSFIWQVFKAEGVVKSKEYFNTPVVTKEKEPVKESMNLKEDKEPSREAPHRQSEASIKPGEETPNIKPGIISTLTGNKPFARPGRRRG